MTSNSAPDPVNRWATEHYGFADEPPAPAPPSTEPAAPPSRPPSAGARPAAPRHWLALVAGGVLGVLLTAGVGAAAGADDGPGGGGGLIALVDQRGDSRPGGPGGPGGGDSGDDD